VTRRALASLCLALCGCASAPVLPPRIYVTVANDLATPICDVHMRHSAEAAAGWSTDWLDREQVVLPGAERRFMLPPGETWDVRLTGCDGSVASQREGVPLSRNTRVPASALPPTDLPK
jgi:hypothetical protein